MDKIEKINEVLESLDFDITDQSLRDDVDRSTISDIKDNIVELYHILQDIHNILLLDEEAIENDN